MSDVCFLGFKGSEVIFQRGSARSTARSFCAHMVVSDGRAESGGVRRGGEGQDRAGQGTTMCVRYGSSIRAVNSVPLTNFAFVFTPADLHDLNAIKI